MMFSITSTVLAFSVTVWIIRFILVTVVLPTFLASTQFNDLHMIHWSVVTILTTKSPMLTSVLVWRRGPVLLTFTLVTLASLNSLDIFHVLQLGRWA